MTLVENDPPLVGAAPGVPPRFTVRLHNFEGPFDLLLQLIGSRELDITEMALHTVTDDFIAHLTALGDDADLDETTEFLVVAATLLDLKAARLLQYRAYKQVAGLFVELEAGAQRRFPRSVALEERFSALLPEVLLGVDPETFAELAASVFRPKPPPTVGIDHLHAVQVSVAEHAAILRERLAELGSATFAELTADCASPLEVVARFLAVLDLFRGAVIDLQQPEPFGELTVRWTPSARDRPEQTPSTHD